MIHTVALGTSLWTRPTKLDVFRIFRAGLRKSALGTDFQTRAEMHGTIGTVSTLGARGTTAFTTRSMAGVAFAINNIFP
jgi:hypothetical protein